MWRLLFTLCLPLTAAAAEVDDLAALNAKVNHGITYLNYAGWDFRDVAAGDYGNCAAIAYTKWKRLEEDGYGDRAGLRTCKIWTGEAHAFVVVDGYVLDNVNEAVRQVEQDGCVADAINLNLTSLRAWIAAHTDKGPLPSVARQALERKGL